MTLLSTRRPLVGVAEVDPDALGILSDRSVSCESPEIDAENAAPVDRSFQPARVRTGANRSLRDTSPAGFHVGPVVMNSGNFSDTRPQWECGGGYPGSTTPAPRSSRVVEAAGRGSPSLHDLWEVVSDSTPPLTRIELAADADGLWMGAGSETAGSPGPILYFVGTALAAGRAGGKWGEGRGFREFSPARARRPGNWHRLIKPGLAHVGRHRHFLTADRRPRSGDRSLVIRRSVLRSASRQLGDPGIRRRRWRPFRSSAATRTSLGLSRSPGLRAWVYGFP